MDSNAATAAGSSQQSTKPQIGNRPDESMCRICNNELKYRQPKLLPCLHTVCSECLQKCSEGNPQTSSNPATRCPVCRQMFSSKDIVDNYFVLGLGNTNSQNPQQIQNTCTSCDDNAQSTWFCENCVEWLCDACKQAHQRVKLTKEHKVSAIATVSSQEYSSKKWFPPCNLHAGQVQWLFCITCEVLICQQCQAAFHRLHRTQVVDSAADNLRRLFKGNFLVRLNEKLQQVTQVKEMISKMKNEITHHEYEITGKMRSLMEKLVLEITNRIVTLNNQLKESCKKKQNFLERQNMEVTHHERALSRCQEFLKTTLASTNDAAVASSKRTIDKQVEFLLRREPTKMPIAGLELTFLLNDNCNILKQIGSLGQLIIKDPLNHIKIPTSAASLTGGISPVGATSSNGLAPGQQPSHGRQNDLIQANLQNMSPAVRGMVTKALQGIDQRNRAFTINHQPHTQPQQQPQPQPQSQPQPQTSSAISAPLPPPSMPRIVTKQQFNQVQAVRLPNQSMTLSVMKTIPNSVVSNGSKGDIRPSQPHRRPVPILPRPAAMKDSDLRIPSITPNSVRSLSEQDILLHIPSIVDEISRTNNGGEQNNNASTSHEGTAGQQPTAVLDRRDSDSGTQNVTSPASQPPSTSNHESRPSSTNSSAAASGTNTDDEKAKVEEIKIKPEPGTQSSELPSCQKETPPVNTDVVADGKYRIWSGQLTWRESSDKSKEPGPLSTVKCHFHDFHTDAPTSISVSSWPEKFSMHLLPRHYIKSIEAHIKGAKKLFIEFDKDDENKKQVDKITTALLADMVGIACYFTGPTKIGVFIVACIRRLQKYVALVPAQQKEVLRTLRDVAGDKMRVYLQEIAKQQPKPVMPATVPEGSQQSSSSSSSPAKTSTPVENHSGKLANLSSMLDHVDNEYTNVPKKSNPDDPNEDWCAVCQNGGDLLCCDSCPRVFHLQCHIPPLLSTPNDSVPWNCTFCQDVTDVSPSHMGNGDADHREEGTKEGEGENGRKRKRENGLTERERQLCERVLLELFCNQSSIPFREPVSQDVPGYYTIITNAMDLSTIKARLVPSNSEYYQSVEDMLSDLKLMFSNCFAYNGTEASISQMAKTLQRHLNRLTNQFLPDYGSDVDRNDPTWSGEDRASKRKRKPKDIVHIK